MTTYPPRTSTRDMCALTGGERVLLAILADNECSVQAAAQNLGISRRTALNRAITIREKLGVETMAEAIAKWLVMEGVQA